MRLASPAGGAPLPGRFSLAAGPFRLTLTTGLALAGGFTGALTVLALLALRGLAVAGLGLVGELLGLGRLRGLVRRRRIVPRIAIGLLLLAVGLSARL